MRKSTIISIVLLALMFGVSMYFYPQMPERIASHWNASGQVNGYLSKFWGLFLLPIISLAFFVVLFFIPYIDPLKKNIDKFRDSYDKLILLFVFFMIYVHLLTISWNLGYKFNITQMLTPALAILFIGIGFILEKTKRNFFIGIRTPWTLSSDNVWDKTHKLGGKLFKISGLIALLGIFLGKYAIIAIIAPIILASIYLVVYSYLEYKKEIKRT